VISGWVVDGLESSVTWVKGTYSYVFLWVLFLDPLYIHRDTKVEIIRFCSLKTTFMEDGRDLLIHLPEFDGLLFWEIQDDCSLFDFRDVNISFAEPDRFAT